MNENYRPNLQLFVSRKFLINTDADFVLYLDIALLD